MNARRSSGSLLVLAVAGWMAARAAAARVGDDGEQAGEEAASPAAESPEELSLERARLEEGLVRAEKTVVLLGELALRREAPDR